jgi:hypothetical protein
MSTSKIMEDDLKKKKRKTTSKKMEDNLKKKKIWKMTQTKWKTT